MIYVGVQLRNSFIQGTFHNTIVSTRKITQHDPLLKTNIVITLLTDEMFTYAYNICI